MSLHIHTFKQNIRKLMKIEETLIITQIIKQKATNCKTVFIGINIQDFSRLKNQFLCSFYEGIVRLKNPISFLNFFFVHFVMTLHLVAGRNKFSLSTRRISCKIFISTFSLQNPEIIIRKRKRSAHEIIRVVCCLQLSLVSYLKARQ